MAFTLQAIVGSTTYNLSDGNPFRLEAVDGIGAPPVQRFGERSPLQDGITDLGYRYEARIITLRLNFHASSAADLDTHRDTLMGIFRPASGQVVKLKLTRDDSSVRQIECYAIGQNDIEIVPVHRPGSLHRAVVQLRAPDPIWYNPTPGTATMTLPVAEWWLGGQAIGTADVVEHVGTPTHDQAWAWSGTLLKWTVVWRMEYAEGGTAASDQYAWRSGGGTPDFFIAADSSDASPYRTRNYNFSTVAVAPGTALYALYHFESASDGIENFVRYDDSDVYVDYAAGQIHVSAGDSLIGSGGYWGGNGSGTASQWPGTITHAAVYRTNLHLSQIQGINYAILAGTASNREVAIAYEGNAPEYPVITITGPVADPVITNVSTGEILDMTGATIGVGDSYTIDLRAEALSIADSGGTVRTSSLTDDSDLGTWALVPGPIAAGGINLVTLSGSATNSDTSVQVVYYNRYVSW